MTSRDVFDRIAGLYAPVAAAVFVLVCLALVIVAVRFRARPGRTPSERESSPRLETGYAVGLGLVAAVLLWQTYKATDDIGSLGEHASASTALGRPVVTVDIVASRWNWRFTYPGGVVQTGDGRERFAQLVVPADQTLRFRLISQDVAHAFWIPALRYKYDAYPGRSNTFDLRFSPGLDYSTARCSEFCGEYHDQMRFGVRVLAPAAFRAWLAQRQAAAR